MWVENEANDDDTKEYLQTLQTKIEELNIYQAGELKIKYADIDFVKNVYIHFDETDLFVINPWTANSVLLNLPEVLCRYFNLNGHDKKLDFLLRSTHDEIVKYFLQERINIPMGVASVAPDVKSDTDVATVQTKSPIPSSFEDIQNAVDEGRIIPELFFEVR
jgi:hypothetical protein